MFNTIYSYSSQVPSLCDFENYLFNKHYLQKVLTVILVFSVIRSVYCCILLAELQLHFTAKAP